MSITEFDTKLQIKNITNLNKFSVPLLYTGFGIREQMTYAQHNIKHHFCAT